MTPEDLRVLNCLYARYVRLTELHPRLSRPHAAEAYMLRVRMEEDFGFDATTPRPDPDTTGIS